MRCRWLGLLFGVLAFLPLQARGQLIGGAPAAYLFCYNGTNPSAPTSWAPCSGSNPVPISGSISLTFPTVGAAVPTTAVYNGINVAGTLRGLTGLSTGALFPATVAIVDASGNQITTFGTAWSNSNKVIDWDGTNNITVKAASTPPATTDTALVAGIADGNDVTQGAKADSAYTGTGAASVVATLKGIYNALVAALPSGTNIIGKVGIDQTTPGTTNGVAAQATENHIGEVGGNLLPITNDMTTTNATTTTGQSIGGLQTLANAVRVSGSLGASGTSGYIQNVTVTFTDAIGSGPLDVYYFNANPSGSTCTNDNAFVLANADRDKVIGVVHVTDFTSSNTAVVAQATNQSMAYGVASATSIYACVVARASFVIAGTANASIVTRTVRN